MIRYIVFTCIFLPTLLVAQDVKSYLLDVSNFHKDTLGIQIEKALKASIVSIVEKPQPSPSGDAHDYISYGRYYWPDPSKPDGLPYISKDGHPNQKQIEQGDEKRLDVFINNVESLALGWAGLHREDCARRAGEWLRTWFVNSPTKINPSFEYAQIRLGRNNNHGSSSGLIDTRGLIRLVDALRLLHNSPGLNSDDEKVIKAWFAEYLRWLTTSPNGRKEHEARNNHGSWYLAQVIAISRILGQDDEARKYAREDFSRISWQIQPDGQQPLETARADGLSYSLFNLQAQLTIARLAAPLGVDLWNFTAPNGGSIKQALEYLKPYDSTPEKWPHNQLAKQKPGFLKTSLETAAKLDAEAMAIKK